jgi:hypothetical protein
MSKRKLLVIATSPARLAQVSRIRHWLPGYDRVGAWVIDSFWTDRISRFALGGKHIDHLFITDTSLVDEWAAITGGDVHGMPWGADTTAFDVDRESREIDLLRVGRQPAAWEDDAETCARAEAQGMTAHGRPPMPPSRNGLENQRVLGGWLSRAKFVLAFSNLVSPGAYTHPTRDYLTGRWMDALAAGATVVGTAPDAAQSVLWDGATREISPTDLDAGLATVRELVDEWTVDQALEQRRRAVASIDWRYRLEAICRVMDVPAPDRLATELDALRAA